MINLYYYNQNVMEHLYLQFVKLPINIEEIGKSNNAKVSISTKILRLFDGNIENTFDTSNMKHIEYSEEFKVLKVIEEMQPKIFNINKCVEGQDLYSHVWVYKGKCKVIQILAEEKKRYIKLEFNVGKHKYEGITSYENWVSSSMLNKALSQNRLVAEVVFSVLSVSKKKIDIQLLWVSNQIK